MVPRSLHTGGGFPTCQLKPCPAEEKAWGSPWQRRGFGKALKNGGQLAVLVGADGREETPSHLPEAQGTEGACTAAGGVEKEGSGRKDLWRGEQLRVFCEDSACGDIRLV